jgi:hypothetical protein
VVVDVCGCRRVFVEVEAVVPGRPLEVVVASHLRSDYLAQCHYCLRSHQSAVEGVHCKSDWPVGDFGFHPLALSWLIVKEQGSNDRAAATPSQPVAELVGQLGLGWQLVWLRHPRCWRLGFGNPVHQLPRTRRPGRAACGVSTPRCF